MRPKHLLNLIILHTEDLSEIIIYLVTTYLVNILEHEEMGEDLLLIG